MYCTAAPALLLLLLPLLLLPVCDTRHTSSSMTQPPMAASTAVAGGTPRRPLPLLLLRGTRHVPLDIGWDAPVAAWPFVAVHALRGGWRNRCCCCRSRHTFCSGRPEQRQLVWVFAWVFA
jgi:hypothetical protein